MDIEFSCRKYYTQYYRDKLGLPDWEARVMDRLKEEEKFGEMNLKKIETWIRYDFKGKCVLVVGAGTGAESFSLVKHGAEVYGIEPNSEALQILKMKSQALQYPAERFTQEFVEDLSYAENSFDFIYCYTVLEHVKNVERTIDEMLRVCKPGGIVCIVTPDYRFPLEQHYKLPMVPFSPKWLQFVLLWLWRRPLAFLKDVTFVNTPQLNRLFWKRNVITLRAYEPTLYQWRNLSNYYQKWFCETFAIQKTQWIFLIKQNSKHS
jgi:ubiquinone/menaquinone biosynthesis C-methylase UbiE